MIRELVRTTVAALCLATSSLAAAAMRMESPFTPLAGGARWDLRVTLTFPDPASAVEIRGAFDKASEAIAARLYPDKAKLAAEERKRFSLLEERWNVVVATED